MDNLNVLQWNAQSVRNKKDEILELISNHQLSILAIQETKLKNNTEFKIPNFNLLHKEGHINYSTHGGVGLFIHSGIPYLQIELNTPLQAVAAKISTSQHCITFLSLYIPGSQKIDINTLNNLFIQLPSPVIIMGDFNAHSEQWGSNKTDCRGRLIQTFCNNNNLNILNDGAPTRIVYNSESAIDLTFCSPNLHPIVDWSVYASPGASDHCPIIISLSNLQPNNLNSVDKYNTRKADWQQYFSSTAWDHLPEEVSGDNNQIINHLYSLLYEAADVSIPKYKPSIHYPKPWWTPELKESKEKREKLYRNYRQNKT